MKFDALPWLILAFLVWLGLTFAPQAQPKDPIADLNRIKADFVDHYEAWQTECNSHSPYSPDYYQKVAEIWHAHEMGKRFRKIESAIGELALWEEK